MLAQAVDRPLPEPRRHRGRPLPLIILRALVETSEACVDAFEFLVDESMSSYVNSQVLEPNGGQLVR